MIDICFWGKNENWIIIDKKSRFIVSNSTCLKNDLFELNSESGLQTKWQQNTTYLG